MRIVRMVRLGHVFSAVSEDMWAMNARIESPNQSICSSTFCSSRNNTTIRSNSSGRTSRGRCGNTSECMRTMRRRAIVSSSRGNIRTNNSSGVNMR